MLVGPKQVQRLWASLTARAGKRPELYPQFTRLELQWWLESKAMAGAAAWACEYKAPGCSGGKFALGITEVSLDHRTPVSKKCGGLTTLENLAICCRHCNTLKGALDEPHFRSLIAFLREWRPDQLSAVVTRLKQPPRAWARAKASAAPKEEF